MTRTVTLVGYAALAVLLVACEVFARRTGRLATFGQVIRALAGRRGTRFLVLAGWLWVGWHLFARAGP